MPKTKIADYDGATAGNNLDIGGISIDEGMYPSTVNNSLRELTRQLGAFADGTDSIDALSVTGTASATTFSGDLSGTINTATTGTTQAAGTSNTTISTTAFAQSAANDAAVALAIALG